MKIYLVRHGIVENPNDVLYGRLPGFHLSKKGQDQIIKLGDFFKDKQIKKIYASPMERTRETAEIIAEKIGIEKEEIIFNERLIEAQCDKYEGTDREEYKKNYCAIICNHEVEPIQDAGHRVYSFLKEIVSTNEDVIVVSHGDPIMGALGHIVGDWAIIQCYIKRGQFIEVEINEGRWQVMPYSETI